MQLKTIKFKNGDVIACGVDDKLTVESLHNYEFITVQDPVIFSTFKFINPMGQVVETIGMAPFLPTSSDHQVLIPSDSILTICNIRSGAEQRYTGYLDMLHREQSGKLDQELRPELQDEIWDAMEEAQDANLH